MLDMFVMHTRREAHEAHLAEHAPAEIARTRRNKHLDDSKRRREDG